MHAVIAQKIERDRKLLDIPRNNLKRWRQRWSTDAPAWYVEWQEIMRRPWSAIASLITEPSEEAVRLRQSSPFAGVLSAQERERIYEVRADRWRWWSSRSVCFADRRIRKRQAEATAVCVELGSPGNSELDGFAEGGSAGDRETNSYFGGCL
jgi:hypothetical protein